MSSLNLETEFLLLVQCCQRNYASLGSKAPLEHPADCNWDRVLKLARRHRVQGLVWNALAQHADRIPDHVRQALSSDARSIAATNLGIAAECRLLLETFQKREVPLLFIKGLSVGALAYRLPLLKMAWDIDLLVAPHDLEAGSQLLVELGYSLRLPANMADLANWHGRSKESVWHRNECFYVELHTRLADNYRLIPAIDVHTQRQTVEIAPGISLPTLAEEELLAYLAVHGASSAWFRLKWISDFAGLLIGRSGEEIECLYDRTQQLGAGRSSGQALLLADRLFDVLQPSPRLRETLSRERATRLLCSAALRMMTKCDSEPTERPFGTLPIHWSQFLLQAGLGFKLSELRRQAGLLMLHRR